jgi:hypothetical protein
MAWVFDGAGTVAQDTGAEVLLLNALTRLDKLLYPSRLPFGATLWDHICLLNPDIPPTELQARLELANDDPYLTTRFRGSRSAHYDVLGRFPNWDRLGLALTGVMVSHDRILRHYGWGKWVAGEDTATDSWPWRWPEVPPLPAPHLESLERSATGFLDLTRIAADAVERAQGLDAKRLLDPADKQPVLECVSAGFHYRGHFLDLCGRPLAMLCALHKARHNRLSADQLREAMKVDDEVVNDPDQVIRDTAYKLRRALREAVARAGRTCSDPLPPIGRGKDLTYKLDLP